MQNETTIISIDTNDPKVELSTGAIVKIIFRGDTKERTATIYTGSFEDNKETLLKFIGNPDHIAIEKIDATNKFIERTVIAEQLAVHKMLTDIHGDKVEELIRSGRKEIVTDALLKQIELWEEGTLKTHHHDIREATRNLIYFMAKSETLRLILSKYVQRFFR